MNVPVVAKPTEESWISSMTVKPVSCSGQETMKTWREKSSCKGALQRQFSSDYFRKFFDRCYGRENGNAVHANGSVTTGRT